MEPFSQQFEPRESERKKEPEDTARSVPPRFDGNFRAHLYDLLRWRRDARRFKRTPLPDGTLERLISIACLSPSVGLSEPWRFVIVNEEARRAAIQDCFEACNKDALEMQDPDKAALYARLKLEGLGEAPVQVAVFADRGTAQGAGLGRLTMPETIDYSVVMAVHTLWLAARAEGLGVGWVSILDPARITEILDVPSDWIFIGHLCIGYPQTQDDTPALERAGWEHRHASDGVVIRR